MDSFFHTTSGRLALILGGADLFLMGIAALVGDPALAAVILAIVPMLSIAVGINIVCLSTIEIGGLLPVGLISMLLFLAGVYVFGLDSAASLGPAAGVLLVVIGGLAALLGLLPSIAAPVATTAQERLA